MYRIGNSGCIGEGNGKNLNSLHIIITTSETRFFFYCRKRERFQKVDDSSYHLLYWRLYSCYSILCFVRQEKEDIQKHQT